MRACGVHQDITDRNLAQRRFGRARSVSARCSTKDLWALLLRALTIAFLG